MTVARPEESAVVTATSEPVEPFDPIALYAAAVEAGHEAAIWLRPSEGFSLVGVGRARAVEPAGPGRFAEAAAAYRRIVAGASIDRPANVRGLGPVLIGGLGFRGRAPEPGSGWSPFGAASLVMPSLAALRTPAGSWLTTVRSGQAVAEVAWPRLRRRAAELATAAAATAPAAEPAAAPGPANVPLTVDSEIPSLERWRHTVGLSAGAVGRGRLDKVVLARRLALSAPVPLDVPAALRRLAATAPESTVFAFRRGEATFMGATPERLVRIEGRAYRTAAIAGSIRRGATGAEDEALARELLASDKEREEHAVVVRTIRRQLAPISERLEIAPEPGVLKLRHVQHLATEIAGTVRSPDGLLVLGELLHPTPAVGGEPRDLALAMIDEQEGFDRGWYAGPIGWLGPDGDGELMVALRCGLVSGNLATLFAGCGIVADSDPDREWDEATMKMRTLAAALGRLEEGR